MGKGGCMNTGRNQQLAKRMIYKMVWVVKGPSHDKLRLIWAGEDVTPHKMILLNTEWLTKSSKGYLPLQKINEMLMKYNKGNIIYAENEMCGGIAKDGMWYIGLKYGGSTYTWIMQYVRRVGRRHDKWSFNWKEWRIGAW